MDKLSNKVYTKHGTGHQRGTGNLYLDEPVPVYPLRKGEVKFPAADASHSSNTMILFGRDRNPYGPPRSVVPHGSEEDPNNPKSSKSSVSGFSDYQCAGAIDIVVGRGSPFPIEKLSHGIYPEGLPPLYTTRTPSFLAGENLIKGKHPGYILDAARIYISQMCQIDDYFEINKIRMPTQTIEDKGPCSAIMIKADKLRMHSRRDIYIVAGGDKRTTHDSNNYKISESAGKIHLVVKNGQDPSVRPTTQAVRYDELKACLDGMCQSIQDILELINNFGLNQKKVNNFFANSIYGTAVGMTTCDPLAQAMNNISQIANMKDLLQIHVMKTYNIPMIQQNYLTAEGEKSIASRHITIN